MAFLGKYSALALPVERTISPRFFSLLEFTKLLSTPLFIIPKFRNGITNIKHKKEKEKGKEKGKIKNLT